MDNREDDRINVELEKKAVATIFEDNTLIDDLIEGTQEDYFTDRDVKKTYQWAKDQYNKSNKISLVKAKTETDINLEYIIDDGIQVMEYSEILNQLHKLYIRRKIAKIGKKIYDLSKKPDMDIDEYQHRAQEIVFDGTYQKHDEDGLIELEDSLFVLHERISELQEGDEKNKKLQGIKTNYPQIDTRTSGLKKGHLVVVGARTSMGKTAFSISLSYKLLKQGYKGCFISLEMNHDEISQRLLALDSRVPASDYDRYGLTEAQRQNMNVSLDRLMNMNFTISDKRGMRTEDIRARCRKVARKKEGIDFIVIDYLQRIPIPRGNKNTAQKIGEMVNQIRDMAGELDCPVLLISQLRRYNDGLPSISYLRNSGEIEEVADDIWLLHRDSYENEADQEQFGFEEAIVIIAKGRTSGTAICNFYWYPEILYWQDELNYNEEEVNIIKGG